MYRILDLDNCISDDGWRVPLINWNASGFDRYHPYHSLLMLDRLGNEDLLNTREELIIITGRPVFYRSMTESWLRDVGVRYKHLIMRNDNDRRRSGVLKREALTWLETMYYVRLELITSAFDDRQEVVQAYRDAGISNAQVRFIHNVDAYNPQKETQ